MLDDEDILRLTKQCADRLCFRCITLGDDQDCLDRNTGNIRLCCNLREAVLNQEPAGPKEF